MMWPPSFCKKGTPNCVGPYMKRHRWEKNLAYDKKKKATDKNVAYFQVFEDYEIGYNWDRAKKYDNFMLQT